MNPEKRHRVPHPRIMPWSAKNRSRELLLTREWLVTNGLGGYASGTISGAITRRYHGLLDGRPAGALRSHGDVESRPRSAPLW